MRVENVIFCRRHTRFSNHITMEKFFDQLGENKRLKGNKSKNEISKRI